MRQGQAAGLWWLWKPLTICWDQDRSWAEAILWAQLEANVHPLLFAGLAVKRPEVRE